MKKKAYRSLYIKNTRQEKIWTFLRIMKVVSTYDLKASFQDIRWITIQVYLIQLEKAGYINKYPEGVYKIVRDTGALSPVTTKIGEGMYDHNIKKFIPFERDVKGTQKQKYNLNLMKEVIDFIREGREFRCSDINSITNNMKLSKGWCREFKDKGITETVSLEKTLSNGNRLYVYEAVYVCINPKKLEGVRKWTK